MTSPLLTTVDGVVALPSCRVRVQDWHSQGVLWSRERQDLVSEALPAIHSLPRRDEISADAAELAALLARAEEEGDSIEEAAIFGGYLYRHFGHFCHQSLDRLWWLGRGDPQQPSIAELCAELRQQPLAVVFFMPIWADDGKDLLPYMREVLLGLGLAPERIRIIDRPLLCRRLLIPTPVWGFRLDQGRLDQQLGCDTRAMMRSLFAGFHNQRRAAEPEQPAAAQSAEKVYVSRSGLPLNLGRPIGDALLDDLLSGAGYRIFRPEQETLRTQLATYAAAKELVFMEGSSLYPLWFTPLRRDVAITVILRRRQGLWICEVIRSLLPEADRIRWRVLQEILGEGLTSDKDWESHNLLDLASLSRRLTGRQPAAFSPAALRALNQDLEGLARELDPPQLASILEVLLTSLSLPRSRRRGHPAVRLRAWLSRLKAALGRRSARGHGVARPLP